MSTNSRPHDLSVLLVDDNDSDRVIAKAFLSALGVTKVHEAEDGSEAFFKLKNASFDLIITDWRMPVVSGLAFLQKLRAHPRYKHVPVLFLTAVADRAEVETAVRSGVNNYLIKPFEQFALHEKMKKLFPKLTFTAKAKGESKN